jgi:hypothetical protein
MKKFIPSLILLLLSAAVAYGDDIQAWFYNSSTGKIQVQTRASGSFDVPTYNFAGGLQIGNSASQANSQHEVYGTLRGRSGENGSWLLGTTAAHAVTGEIGAELDAPTNRSLMVDINGNSSSDGLYVNISAGATSVANTAMFKVTSVGVFAGSGATQPVLSIVGSGTGGSATIGAVNSCASATVNQVNVTWVKYSDGRMLQYGSIYVETNNANATCASTSVSVTLPQAFAGQFFPTCGVGQRNASTGSSSAGGSCKIANRAQNSGFEVPANDDLRMIGDDFVTWTSGNQQVIEFYFQAWGTY